MVLLTGSVNKVVPSLGWQTHQWKRRHKPTGIDVIAAQTLSLAGQFSQQSREVPQQPASCVNCTHALCENKSSLLWLGIKLWRSPAATFENQSATQDTHGWHWLTQELIGQSPAMIEATASG